MESRVIDTADVAWKALTKAAADLIIVYDELTGALHRVWYKRTRFYRKRRPRSMRGK